MLRLVTTLLVIFAVLLPGLQLPIAAQAQSKLKPAETTISSSGAADRPDFKRIFEDETRKFSSESSKFDPAKLDAKQAKQQAKAGWSKKDKIFMAAFIVGIAVLVVVLIKYGKECLRTSPTNCTVGVDEICTCEEYAPRN